MMNFYKILFTLTLLMSTLISVSSYTWMGMWMGLEINTLSIIPLLKQTKNSLSSESSIKYFIVQALTSMIFMFSMIVMMKTFKMNMNFNFSSTATMIMNSALLTKMGAAPFHFWFPEVMEGLSWMNCLILLTWQKITPMILLMYNIKPMFFHLEISTCMVISCISAINQNSIRKILSYSSINHMGWMMASMMISETLWTIYFMIYSMTNAIIIMILKTSKIYQFKQLFPMLENNFNMKLLFMMSFLSMGGLPPFMGFFPKWLIVQSMTQNSIILPLIMIMFTLIMLFTYIRLMISSMLISFNQLKFSMNLSKNSNYKIKLINFIFINSLIISTILFNWI